MEKDLKNIRLEINSIDQEMKNLFIKRMNLVKEVIQYKKEHNIEILDSSRENEVIDLNSKELINNEFYSYYIQYLRDIMKISKDYQKDYITKGRK